MSFASVVVAPASIEIVLDGATIRVPSGSDAATLRAVLAGGQGGVAVIVPSGAVRVLVATRPVDFRKGMDGLAALVREGLGCDPFSGVIYVFRSKRADRLKLLLWDGSGLVLLAKRLEQGGFRWPSVGRWRDAADRRRSSRRCSTAWTGRGCVRCGCARRRRCNELRQVDSGRVLRATTTTRCGVVGR